MARSAEGVATMFAQITHTAITLDLSTLLTIATCVTALLGTFLLFAWTQDRIRPLAWWGAAYLLGSVSLTLWSVNSETLALLPAGFPSALMFVSCGMIWSAARIFHGRDVPPAMLAGAVAWLIACTFPAFLDSSAQRIMLSSVIISAYAFLTATELWRERRKQL